MKAVAETLNLICKCGGGRRASASPSAPSYSRRLEMAYWKVTTPTDQSVYVRVACSTHPDAPTEIEFDGRYANLRCAECGQSFAIIEYKQAFIEGAQSQ